jgi:superfamily II DNA or RNA helicase
VAVKRYSSRRGPLVSALRDALRGARSYDRIAGYFSSSILEVAGEALDSMADSAPVRVVCNSRLDPLDVATAKAAKQAMYREWCASLPEHIPDALTARLQQLYRLLSTGRLQVRVLPDDRFGLIHGKAGVITGADGSKLAFLGSANETKSGLALNYELVWSDDGPDAVNWVQEEFDALWTAHEAVELAEAVVTDVARLAARTVVPDVQTWREREDADPAAPVVELPVYRRDNGLWAHQKYFVRLAFEEHRRGGARFVLADQVGLGKTIQLGLAAKLMALWGGGRVLVLVPKPIGQQWQDELWRLLQLPSALWNGRSWVDENGVEYPDRGADALTVCPRRVVIVSTGMVVQSAAAARTLASLEYECVILDEAHRARRRNLGRSHLHEGPEPNNLLRFLDSVSRRTRSMLLATATPVQLDAIEAWDLLNALGQRDDRVLGTTLSLWRQQARDGIDLVSGGTAPPSNLREAWEWIRNPLPPSSEDRTYEILRKALDLPDETTWARADAVDQLKGPDRARLQDGVDPFFAGHHPYIRRIVRRSREFLERTIDPQTHEPYLAPIAVRLFGERASEAIVLPVFLQDAYEAAEAFCQEVGARRGFNSGFLKTVLLRRVGSTIRAGQLTARKFLGPGADTLDEDDEGIEEQRGGVSTLYPLLPNEKRELERFLSLIESNRDEDPKAREVERIVTIGHLDTRPWLELGCVVFSQYLDSILWLATCLSESLPDERIGVYAGAGQSGVYVAGQFTRLSRDDVRLEVRGGTIRLLLGTDAASEGLNLQRLGSLINLDLPWNPTRLEQRKGRIQRIGQPRSEVLIYNMRYRGSVEDRVHDLLSARFRTIHDLFGQLPDTLEDVWVQVALRDEERARQIIDTVPSVHPFEMRYDRIAPVDFESCSRVLDTEPQLELLREGW